eukprot:10652759-Prorocentrum_lima.AAC.1
MHVRAATQKLLASVRQWSGRCLAAKATTMGSRQSRWICQWDVSWREPERPSRSPLAPCSM